MIDTAKGNISHERSYDLHIFKKLFLCAGGESLLQHIAVVSAVLEQLIGTSGDPWTDLFKVRRGMQFVHDRCAELVGNDTRF